MEKCLSICKQGKDTGLTCLRPIGHKKCHIYTACRAIVDGQQCLKANESKGLCQTHLLQFRGNKPFKISRKLTGNCLRGQNTIKNGKLRPEYQTVSKHWRWIFKDVDSRLHSYKGMPFYDGWNPDKGGFISAGCAWIIDNLGIKSVFEAQHGKSSLDIIDHRLGFVPGNLRWSTRKDQALNRNLRVAKDETLIRELNHRGYMVVKES